MVLQTVVHGRAGKRPLAKHGKYRHAVFEKLRSWKLPCPPDSEFDQFDSGKTGHIFSLDQSWAVIGTARLLPTTKEYLLGEFPK
ncbi:hypothetical protein FOC84_06645 [Achromobacter pestifer]|uniref:Acyl-homoserine-lactone synthase n=1 Tax=Achromobacter pestifer TaxID=1353889 RepID=A0A7D4E2Q4_9BURK|nr:acyl-homoserine-lactone synthase [Achromobacter pestifer]QKH34646.1 hypothetical protein FOC84_06645 [Achromobacter pestifer]